MGLDMYAYATDRAGRYHEYWEDYHFDGVASDYVSGSPKPREIAYWRKHPNLHGWMERLWLSKINIPAADSDQFIQDQHPPVEFNGIELELTWEDIEQLERDILERRLPPTQGFFFGRDSDDEYHQQDLEFVKNARAELFLGLKVFYNSSW